MARRRKFARMVAWLFAWSVDGLFAIKRLGTPAISRRTADRGLGILPTFLRHCEVGS